MNKGASMRLKCVCLTKQSKRKRKRDLWLLLAPYIKHTDRKLCRKIHNLSAYRVKSWTSTIIWDIYNVIFFFLVNYVSGPLWCSRILSRRGQSLTLNECCSTECTNQTVSWNIHKIKQQHWYKSVQFTCPSDAFRYYSNSRVFFKNHPGSNSIHIKIKWCVNKGIVHPKNENSVIIYSPSSRSKSVWMSLFWTQRKLFWRKFVIRLFWGTIDFHSRRKNTIFLGGGGGVMSPSMSKANLCPCWNVFIKLNWFSIKPVHTTLSVKRKQKTTTTTKSKKKKKRKENEV